MRYAAIIIGTGFGGAILAGRLAKKHPSSVLVLERGKRYPMGSFPRSPIDMANNFWNQPNEKVRRPDSIGEEHQQGLFDIRNFRHMDVVTAAGLGGGSLIYANVFMEPPDDVFASWPSSCTLESMQPYYNVTKSVLGARPVPQTDEPARRLIRTELFQDVAKELGRESKLTDINVFFGNDFDNPTPIGLQETNRYGAVQTSCTYCGECDAGCNTHSKNTLDLNYLFVAENRYGADVRTEHIAGKIVPIDANEQDDPSADGSHGYRVYFRDLTDENGGETSAITDRVIVSAGAIGSTEILS